MRRRIFKRVVSLVTTVTTIVWSLGINLLVPNAAWAAITVSGPAELAPPEGMHLPASSFDAPILKFSLTQSASETLSSVTVTLANATGGAVSDATLASHIASLSVYRDSNGNNFFDPQNDGSAGTQSTVNVGATTAITTGSNNSLAASGSLATTFFVVVKTAAGWTGADAFKINMAANGIAASSNSPTITAFTGANKVDANTQAGGGSGGFSVQRTSFVNATTLDVMFSDFLDLNSGQATSTANYTLSGSGSSAVTSVTLLSDNKSVRVGASGATLISTGASLLAVSASVKNQMGIANANTAATPIFDSFQPLIISEVKAGSAGDQYDEFVEIYNRSGGAVGTSTFKLHLINAAGTVDINVPLTFMNGVTIPASGFFLVAPVTSPASTTADAVYTTSSLRSIIPDGALYISNNIASSTAVIDRVCWGVHTQASDCEGSAAPALANDGASIERKANNSSTSATMSGGADAVNGNGQDSQNNSFDFVARSAPQAQNSASAAETPGGGSWGGATNQAPTIQLAPIFSATASSTFTVIARMTDDGGLLSANKTQLLYCVTNTNCAPATSTPIYGVSIGSGWYKFSTTDTVWSNNKTIFKYYLQATDNATPAKTRVYTADPSFDSGFDSSTGGIQTTVLQQSKSFSITLSQGNLGTTSISGTINSSSGLGVSGATVWIEGTQFSATTGNDGTFSFANIGPSGGKQLKVAKDGFVDQSMSIFVPSSGLVSLPTITLYSGTMGQGGDFNLPKVISSNPLSNSTGFPTQGISGGAPAITLNFSKSLEPTSYVTTTADSATAGIYLTEAGSMTKIAGRVTAPVATQAVFTPSAALTAGKGYMLFVTPSVKDTAGNPVSGNGPGGQYILMFSTAGQFFSNFNEIGTGGTSFGMGNAFPPFVKGSMPAPGSQSVARSAKVFVTFSEAMQDTAVNRGKVVLYSVTSPFTSAESKTAVDTSNSFDTSGKILILAPASTLSAATHYRAEVLGGITSSKGIPLGNPMQSNFSTTAFYKSDFDAGSSSDTTAPTIASTIPAASATGASTINPIVINFSEAMDPSTITNSSIILKLGSTAVDGTLNYDSNSWTAKFIPTYALTATSTFTLDITTDVKDLSGNALASELLRTFTTGSADVTTPTVVSAQGNDFALKVVYSKPMLSVPSGDLNFSSSALNPANYSIRVVSSAGVVQSTLTLPATATLNYEPSTRSVAINGLPTVSGFTAGTTLFNVLVSNVKDSAFNDLAASGKTATSTVQSSSMGGGFSGGTGLFQDASGNNIQGGQFGPPPTEFASFKSSGIGFIPSVHVLPFTSLAGVSTIYGVDAPISKQIAAGGFIDITLPDGTDVSQAKQDTNSPKNSDLNGPGTGTVVFGTSEGTLPSGWTTGGAASDGVIVNTSANTIRVILGSVATRSESSDTHDFLRFDIAQVTNPSTVTNVGTAGNTATVETKKSDGTTLENLTSGSFFTTPAGTLTLRGQLLAGATGLNGVSVFLMSPQTGPLSTSTANSRFGSSDGEFMFQNLNSGMYMLGVQQYFKAGGTSYSASFPMPVNVNSTNCVANICTQNVSATNAATGATVTLSITGTFNAAGDAVDIFASGPGSFRMATTTLTGVLTSDTTNSIKLNANGSWNVGFGPSLSTEIFGKGGPAVRPSWIVPKPQQVTVTGCPAACSVTPNTIVFSSSIANKTVKFTVKDASGNKLGQAHVFAYSPSSGVGNDTEANADGTGSIKLANGTFKIAASVPGMPSGGEHVITLSTVSAVDKVFIDGSATGIALSAMTADDLTLTLTKSSYTISGKVTDGTNPVSNAPVSAFRSDGQGHANTFTNSSGEYTMYVNNGAWRVSAFLPQQFGKLPEKSITINGASASSQNFEPDTSSISYATVTKSIYLDLNGDGVSSGGEAASTTQISIVGTTGDLNNDGDTSDSGENSPYINSVMTDTNGSSTLKVPPGTYTMKAWSPTNGDMPAFNASLVINGAGTVTTQPSDLLAPKIGTVTVNILDSTGAATTTDQIAIEFEQIGGKTDNAALVSNVSSTSFTLPVYDAGADNVTLGAVTSTSPNNFYLMKIITPGVSAAGLLVSGGGSTIMATSTAVSGDWKVEVDGNEIINIRLPAIKYVSGTVKDESGTAVPDAVVHIENKTTGETVEVKADTSGVYSTKLSSGTYLVQAEKDGYIDTATSVTVSSDGALAASATTVAAANRTISGTISADSSGVSGATVRAEKLGGGVVTATADSTGAYTLNVNNGDWKVSASADGYSEKSYSSVVSVSGSNISAINITATATATSLSAATSLALTPQAGGTLDDTAASTTIKAPQSALASSANNYSLSEKETSNVVGGGSGTPIAGEAKSITSYTNDGKEVTTLNGSVGISSSYSTTDLATSLGTLSIAKLEKVKMGSWDSTTDNWENLPTTIAYKDVSGNFVEPTTTLSNVASVSYTGQTVHLSVFNPISSSDGLAPSAPTAVSGVASGSAVTVSWTAPTTNSDATTLSDLLGYEVYRSTSAGGSYTQLNSSEVSGTSYSDTTVIQGQTYYYKVTAADNGGSESTMSSASASITVTSFTGGGNFTTNAGASPGGGGGAPAATAPATVTTPAATTPASAPAATVAVVPIAPSAPAISAVSNPASAISIAPPSSASLKPGAAIKFSYEYQNKEDKVATIRVVRQLVAPSGKVLSTIGTKKKLKAEQTLVGKINEPLPRSLPAGEYTVKVKILDLKNKVLDENSFTITVQRPPAVKAKIKTVVKSKAANKVVKLKK